MNKYTIQLNDYKLRVTQETQSEPFLSLVQCKGSIGVLLFQEL